MAARAGPFAQWWDDPDAMVSWHGADGRYLEASPGAGRVIGWTAEEIVHISPYDLLHPEDLGMISHFHDGLWSGKYTDELVVFRIKGADDRFRWVRTATQMHEDREWGPVTVSLSRAEPRQQQPCITTSDGKLLRTNEDL